MLLQKLRGNKKKGREGWGEGQRKYGYLLRTVSMKHMKSVLFILIKIKKRKRQGGPGTDTREAEKTVWRRWQSLQWSSHKHGTVSSLKKLEEGQEMDSSQEPSEEAPSHEHPDSKPWNWRWTSALPNCERTPFSHFQAPILWWSARETLGNECRDAICILHPLLHSVQLTWASILEQMGSEEVC